LEILIRFKRVLNERLSMLQDCSPGGLMRKRLYSSMKTKRLLKKRTHINLPFMRRCYGVTAERAGRQKKTDEKSTSFERIGGMNRRIKKIESLLTVEDNPACVTHRIAVEHNRQY